MGKPYASEILGMARTYAWALRENIVPLQAALEAIYDWPLLAVGTGGSFSVAHFAAYLHQKHSAELARAVTPLEAVSLESVKNSSVLFVSAGGRNPDVIGAFQTLVRREPRHLIVITATKESHLATIVSRYKYVELIEFEPPLGRDGFLATNTLLAFSVLLARAYCSRNSTVSGPRTLRALVHPERSQGEYVACLRKICDRLWEKESLLVLHGISTHSAAIDLESKFSEGALGPVQIADYRNFAHGRHHWLAKRGNTTGVIALVSVEDLGIAERTIALLPKDTAVVELRVPQRGEWATVSALVSVMHIVGLAAISRGIDPGRPGVPPFGRRIYNLNVWRKSRNSPSSLMSPKRRAIDRKLRAPISCVSPAEVAAYERAYDDFVLKLESQAFASLVLDYDGTLCSKRDRFRGVRREIGVKLIELLSAGICVGIATGRGKSVKRDLRRVLPRRLWASVVVGYYNGADIGLLGDDSHPDSSSTPCPALLSIVRFVLGNQRIALLAECESRSMQLTIVPRSVLNWEQVWNEIQQAAHLLGPPGVRVVRSSHSMDVLAPGVSKRNLVRDLESRFMQSKRGATLCIGDLGCWPGNDFELLAGEHSLSVDQVPTDPLSCWNVAPAGHRGVQATLGYLRAIRVGRSRRFRMDVRALQLR